MKKFSPLNCFAFSLWTAASLTVLAPAAFAQQNDPLATRPFSRSKPIPGHYIVVLKPSVIDPLAESVNITRQHGGQVTRIYGRALKGFAVKLPDAALQGMRNHPNVDYIEQDQAISLNQVSPANQATWGLDRIDQADRPLDTQYHFNTTGAGVYAFILDTGIRTDHVEFNGRLLAGYNVVADTNGTNDCNGHGTHVAGTVGGTTWGVAKGASLIPVRVLDCAGSGSYSGIIAGIDWMAASTLRPAVANMSLGGGISSAVNAAVAGAVSKGITMVVAAGNANADACNYSPASEPSAITVGATASNDTRASYSNFGSCLDIFAPGSSISSAWHTSATASNTISGTSMAAPHVAGVAALVLATNPTASPAAVASFLVSRATPNRLDLIGTGSPNLLAFSLATGFLPTPAVQNVAVKSLAGKAVKAGADWRANVTVTIRDISSLAAVANAAVSGSFSTGGTVTCVTASTGSCILTSGKISRQITSTAMTVSNVAGTNMAYDSSQNAASQITITKP